jgi:NADH-quinone oxidoreductase subunit C
MSDEKRPEVGTTLGEDASIAPSGLNGGGVKGPLDDLKEEAQRLGASSAVVEHGDLIVTVDGALLFDFLKSCKELPHIACAMLVDLTVVDWLDSREARFEVVYQLLSLTKKHRMTVKVPVLEDRPEVPSVVALWAGANFLEREAWDMYGVVFKGHPDLRRILMYEEFVGHPLRKDYPLQGKQPRVPLRMPEVENTARRMHRGDLVQIRKKGSVESSVVSQQSR